MFNSNQDCNDFKCNSQFLALLFVFVLTVNYNIVEMSFHLDAVLLSQSQKRVRRDRNFRLDDVLLQHIQDLLPRNSLELTTSEKWCKTPLPGEIVSFPRVLCEVALYFTYLPKNLSRWWR